MKKMPICKECGSPHLTDNEYFCPKCEIKHQKRDEFRKIMEKLSEIANLDHSDGTFMSGFAYSELERFSLTFRRLQKRYYLPIEKEDFKSEHARKEAEEVF